MKCKNCGGEMLDIKDYCVNCGAKLKQREDDSNEEAIRTRLSIYDEKTRPLVEYYEAKGVVTNQEVSEKINRLGQDVADEVYAMITK